MYLPVNSSSLFFFQTSVHNKTMEIRHHALLYALICKHTIEHYGKEAGEDLIRKITEEYGRQRGKRMASHSLKKGMNEFFLNGEWKGKEGENISSLSFYDDRTESVVSKCAWYDSWKEYGMEGYGSYYCRYIDKAICEGYGGNFDLELRSAIGLGDEECVFSWSGKGDPETVEKSQRKYILPFDFHCRELYECAERYLPEEVLEKIRNDFREFFNREVTVG